MCKDIKCDPLDSPHLVGSLWFSTGPMVLRRCGWPELCMSAHLRQAPFLPINQAPGQETS